MATITISQLILLFDLIGVIACTIAATVLAERKGLDLFGAFLVSGVASIGGGTVRDLMLDNHPLFWLSKNYYLLVIFSVSFLTLLLYRYVVRIEKVLRFFDAIGLSAFTIIGVEVALHLEHNAFIAIIMGVVTATVGGMTRDIICNEIPLVLRQEIYITASVVGGCVLLILKSLAVNDWLAFSVTMVTIFTIRMVAVHKGLTLPKVKTL